MARPKKTAATDALRSWEEIGEILGISTSQARRDGLRAIRKLRAGLATCGVDAEYLAAHESNRDRQVALTVEAHTEMLRQDESK